MGNEHDCNFLIAGVQEKSDKFHHMPFDKKNEIEDLNKNLFFGFLDFINLVHHKPPLNEFFIPNLPKE